MILMYTSHLFLRKSPHPPGPSTLREPSAAGSVLEAHSRESGDRNDFLYDFGKVAAPFWLSVSFLISDLQRMDSKGASSSKTLMMMRMLRVMR